jgi:predicted transposase YbfD/YdcC
MPVVTVSSIPSVVEVIGRHADPPNDPLASGLLDVLRAVPDPRDRRGRRYPLWGLLAAAILATAAGMRSVAGIATWARTAPIEVLTALDLRARPSEKTFRSLFAKLDAADLDQRLGAYFSALTSEAATGGPVAVALDGKTLRGARTAGGRAPHLVSVFAHRARLVLGQLAVAAKSNEIPAMRKLLRACGMTGLLVTLDAMHTQVATAKLICGTLKSHYLMVAKDNQPGVLARIKAQPWSEVPVAHRESDDKASHGRIEARTLKILTSVRGIGFPYARQLIEATRERLVVSTGKYSVETVYAICSLAFENAKPHQIAEWMRGHWGIENAVHYVRDVTWDEDRSTVRTGTTPQVMATLRNTALSLHRLHGSDNIAEACRTTAFSHDRGIRLLHDHQTTRSAA